MENEKSPKNKRIKRVAAAAALFILLGTAYAIIASFVGFGIPCVFYKLTGLKCPGCGMTRAMVALIHFDIFGAVQHNAFLFLIIAYVLLLGIHTAMKYIHTGKFYLGTAQNFVDITFLVLLIIWGIARNIIGI